MDPQSGNPSQPNRRENQIQGPRPSPLRINKDSHKISKKPPIAPKPTTIQQPLPATGNQPVIIYSVSPKPIIVDSSNFRSIVQHLTGNQANAPDTAAFPGDLPVSPAARFASIERTSPSERNRRETRGDEIYEMMMMIGDERGRSDNTNNNCDNYNGNSSNNVVDVGQNPGILSPSPANLPAISSAMFSPMSENQLGLGFGMNDILMSPFMSNSFLPSPSSLFLNNAPIVSPSPSSLSEFYNIFDF